MANVIIDPRIGEIEPIQVIGLKAYMIPSPKIKKIRFEDEDPIPSEELPPKPNTEEWVDYQVILAYHSKTKQSYLGIKFPAASIVYMKVNIERNKNGDIFGVSTNHDLIFNKPRIGSPFLGLRCKLTCNNCHKSIIKIYRCYDCLPHKTHKWTDTCRTCYLKRDHRSTNHGHRTILLSYDEDTLDQYEYLEGHYEPS